MSEMKWIVVRTYGNGKYMSRVHPMWFEWLSQAEEVCYKLNETPEEEGCSDKWVVMPLTQYIGSVW